MSVLWTCVDAACLTYTDDTRMSCVGAARFFVPADGGWLMAADDKVKCALPVCVWTSSNESSVACRRQRGAGGVHILVLKGLGAAVVLRNCCIPVHHDCKKRQGTLGPCMPLAPRLAIANQRPLSIRTFFTFYSESRLTADKVHVCSR